MSENKGLINWTKVDEAPALATYSLLPIIKAFTKKANIKIQTKDISLAGRILANFPDYLEENQRVPDALAELGELTHKPDTNIIKLPNISASIPQLQAAIEELQSKGYNIPDFPEEPKTDKEKELRQRFSKLLGSAVNPVLRQGNSDRRAAESVKKFAQKYPHKMMKPWSTQSKSHVAHMNSGDFYENEKSINLDKESGFKIVFLDTNGNEIILKENLTGLKDEVLDATFMSKNALKEFYAEQIKDAKEKEVLLSLHLKATMMKVSDPIMFGHAVEVFYKDILEKYKDVLDELGFNPNNGISDLYDRIENLEENKRKEIIDEILKLYNNQPKLAMVDSDKGITNLHAPNLVIIDASMPVVVRDGGKMWGPDGQLHDTKAMIPDRSYAGIYKVVIEDAKKNGQFDPATMGTVQNVGLMAQKAEEYGSHPTTFEIKGNGTVKVIDDNGKTLMEHQVEDGDIWRMSRVKDIPVKDWVKLAVTRARATGYPTVFWLDENRAHDRQVIKKVNIYLKDHDTTGLDIRIMSPKEAMKFTLDRVRKGQNTISVTGNVLRDYLTDLFPILELGTSARMLSVVPLIDGGGLFETGAGGSAPKHVQQFLKESHLRWDSLGEFLALTESFKFISEKFDNTKAQTLADTLDKAIGDYLENKKSPGRKVGELDNRGSHFYLAMYWAAALSKQNEDKELKEIFSEVAKNLEQNEKLIISEIAKTEGHPSDIGGYYLPDDILAEKAMRPSDTLNGIIDSI
ncbi:MAG TPA: NADP-dependent isocitrate dehydrogenase [Bacteroidetes bacterium]|nr:NADP-dependent isocitrate dehydrogenase [Bacteroidota bacterium]